MAQELIYTSAERGLRPGTRGFCTVAYTQGMLPQTIQLLEALSAYKNLYAAHESMAESSPVALSHCRGNFLGRTASILSRVGPTHADHTNRSNKLAHHLLIQQRERPLGGPAWLASQPDIFCEDWAESPHVITEPRTLPAGDEENCRAETWERLTGDAGHAGLLASSFHANPEAITVLVFTPGMDMLGLIREALRLLPVSERWNVTFSTYFTSLPAGATCAWRCCVADSEELREARRHPRTAVIDLTAPLTPVLREDRFVRLAREGGSPEVEPAENENDKPLHFKLLSEKRDVNQITLRSRRY